MPRIVNKQSLYALAILVFAQINYEDDKQYEAAYNMGDSVAESLERLLKNEHDFDMGDPIQNHFVSGFTEGAVLGLATAAAIITHGFDSDAVKEAVKAELHRPGRWWPKVEKEAA
jgi:hypothetical protein